MAVGERTFQFDACLGRGGFGEVYRARMRRPSGFETEVAVKLLRADVDPRGQAALRLRDEARLLGLVRHRAIPRVLDLVELDGRAALVSEYVEGADLSACLRMQPRLSARGAVEVAAAVADALHAGWHTSIGQGRTAHIVHRDLKPANIRIARDGSVKLLDFGIAWTDEITRVAHTQTATLVGSPAYMAPERFDGAAPSPANDIFSLGAVLFECLAGPRLFGELPFKTAAAIALFEDRYGRALEERLPLLPSTLPSPLFDLICRMLAWRVGERPDALACTELLETIAAEMGPPSLSAWCRARTWPDAPGHPGPWVGRHVTEASLQPAQEPEDRWTGPDVWVSSTDLEPLGHSPGALGYSPGVLPVTLETSELSAVGERGGLPRPPTWAAGAMVVVAGLSLGLALLSHGQTPAPTAPPTVGADASTPPLSPASMLPVVTDVSDAGPTLDAAPLAAVEHDAPPPREPVVRKARPAEVAPERSAAAPVPPRGPSTAGRVTSPRVDAPASEAGPPEPALAVHRARIAPALPSVDSLLEAQPPTPAPPVVNPVAASPPVSPTASPPAADAEPAPPSGALVEVHASSSVTVIQLTGPGGFYLLPARVPAGRYRVLAEFSPGMPAAAGAIDVAADGVMRVRCAMGLCRAIP